MHLYILTYLAYSDAFTLQLKCLENLTVLVWYVWLGKHCLVLTLGIQMLAKLPAVETRRPLKLPCHVFMGNSEAVTIEKVEMVLCESLLQLLSQGELSLVHRTELWYLQGRGSWRCGEALGRGCGAATELPLTTDCKCLIASALGFCLAKKIQKQRSPNSGRIEGSDVFRAVKRPLHQSLLALSSSLHSIAWVTFQCPYGVGHPGTTLDQRDEGPRPVGLKRNVCL